MIVAVLILKWSCTAFQGQAFLILFFCCHDTSKINNRSTFGTWSLWWSCGYVTRAARAVLCGSYPSERHGSGAMWMTCKRWAAGLCCLFFTGAFLVKRAAVLNYLRIPLREAHALERLKVIVTLSPWQILVRILLLLFLAHGLFGWSTACLCHVILFQEQWRHMRLKDETWLPCLRCHVVLSRTHLEAMAATGWLSAVMSDKLIFIVLFMWYFSHLVYMLFRSLCCLPARALAYSHRFPLVAHCTFFVQ